MIGNLICMDDWGRSRSVCMSCLSGTALPGPNFHSCMPTQEREVYAGKTPPPNPSLFSWITCYRFNLHLALRWCISVTDDGAPTSGPPMLASDVSAGLLNKEEAELLQQPASATETEKCVTRIYSRFGSNEGFVLERALTHVLCS
jgi:hypothetical protein